MGIMLDDARLLLRASELGLVFGRTLTIGRQNFYLNDDDVDRLSAEADFTVPEDVRRDAYVDSWLRALGSSDVVALDASAYEGAALVHDMNTPIPAGWHEQFDSIVEAGSLEHIFDVRQAFANLMQLAKVGGHVIATMPANNQCGHG